MTPVLTIVLRFTTLNDLTFQLDNIGDSLGNETELLCIGCGNRKHFDAARESLAETRSARFEYVDGDYAVARTMAATLAKGDFVIFAGIDYSYDWKKTVECAKEAASLGSDVAVLRSRNRGRIPNRKKGAGAVRVNIQDNPQNYFQIIGCTLSYTAISKKLLDRIDGGSLCESCHDSAFSVAVAYRCESAVVSGTKTNAVEKNEQEDYGQKRDLAYASSAIADSVGLLFKIRDDIIAGCNDKLIDSFWRVFASRIKMYLVQNAKYSIRRAVLEALSDDDSTCSRFLSHEVPDWPASSLKAYEFVKWAMRTFLKLAKTASYDPSQTVTIVKAAVENPRVSMICPVYDSEAYIEQTIKSALAQTYPDFEIICVNDGSTDNSLEILESLAKEDGRISVLTQPNMGQSIARNAALKVARGEFVYFFDSDDLLDPRLLEVTIKAADEKSLDAVLFDARTFYDSDELAEGHDSFNCYYSRSGEYNEVVSGIELMRDMDENKEYRVSPCMYLAKRSVIENNDIRFAPGIIHEDNAFTFLLMSYVESAFYLNEALYLRRVREYSVMTLNKTFNNSYGYFVCSQIVLGREFSANDPYRDIGRTLAVNLSYSMLKIAQKDLLEAQEGQEGGTYALDDIESKMFRLLVLDTVNPARKSIEEASKNSDLKERLAQEKAKCKKLSSDMQSTSLKQEGASSKGLFSSLRNKRK